MSINTRDDIDFKTKTSKYRAFKFLKLMKNSKIIQENQNSSQKNYILIRGHDI